MVQLIGGEPLTSPYAAPLIEHALGLGLRVEVFTNLYKVTDAAPPPGIPLAPLELPGILESADRVLDGHGDHHESSSMG
jgi:hypothetical protein